jgi:hypothetical protein
VRAPCEQHQQHQHQQQDYVQSTVTTSAGQDSNSRRQSRSSATPQAMPHVRYKEQAQSCTANASVQPNKCGNYDRVSQPNASNQRGAVGGNDQYWPYSHMPPPPLPPPAFPLPPAVHHTELASDGKLIVIVIDRAANLASCSSACKPMLSIQSCTMQQLPVFPAGGGCAPE